MTLRVKLEIVPFGVEEEMYEIGRLDIFNKGHDPSLGPSVCKYGTIDLTDRHEGLYDREITHNRTDGAWQLVKKAIDEYDLH